MTRTRSGGPALGKDGHKWAFKARFRARAFGWRGSRPAADRLHEAVTEIQAVARVDPVRAADGAVTLMERLWPALEQIDTSSGMLGTAVNKAIDELIPFLIAAPADQKLRAKWLERLYQAVLDDGVQYLWQVEARWGEIAVHPALRDHYIDQLLPLLRRVWSDDRPGGHVVGTDICLSSLLEAGRYQDLMEVLALMTHRMWGFHHFAAEALARQGKPDDAIAYAETCRDGRLAPYDDGRINAFCERVLIAAGRSDEAYRRYGVHARLRSTYLAVYKDVVARYPGRDSRQILRDLIQHHGNSGKWFAAARGAGFLDIALECAAASDVEPATLVRAARDLVRKEPRFAAQVALLAIDALLRGAGYEPTVADIGAAFDHLMAAATTLGLEAWAIEQVKTLCECPAGVAPGPFRQQLLQRCAAGSQGPPG